MSTAISSWVAHATREPSPLMLAGMTDWCDDFPTGGDPRTVCPWLNSELHRLVIMHVDRAAHKRRHAPTFMCRSACGAPDHGLSPMTELVREDVYGAKPLSIVHETSGTALGHAIDKVRGDDACLAVALIAERDFEDADFFDEHRSANLSPVRDGVALAIIHAAVDRKENADDEAAREDLLRASGYSMYMFDLRVGEETHHMHRRLALLMEDVFDEITQIKADAAARILTAPPLWPAVVMRTGPEWRGGHPGALEG